MYLPTSEEKKRCIEIVKNSKKITDCTLIEQYADEVLKIAYSIGGSYSDENMLKKIIDSLD